MGCSWLPEPPVGHHSPTDISIPTVFLADSDEDQQPIQTDDIRIENDGYRLLSDSENQQDYETMDEEEVVDSDQFSINFESEREENVIDSSTNEVSEDSGSADNSRRDIIVDFDRVREAMTHITLPASATPPWATAIPDSDWCSFLQDRIRLLQEKDSVDPASENKDSL